MHPARNQPRIRRLLARRILAMAVIGLSVALMAAPAAAAYANQAKTALPTIKKAVSADGLDYGKAATGTAGHRFQYRITLTMPEDVARLETLLYTVKDKPDAAITPIADSVHAVITDGSKTVKTALEPTAKLTNGTFFIALGDVKKACPDLAFGDAVVIDYVGGLSKGAKPGEYPNIARLTYDRGAGPENTVDVKALVKVPQPANPNPGKTAPPASRLPKTSDALPIGAMALAIIAGSIALAARHGRIKAQE